LKVSANWDMKPLLNAHTRTYIEIHKHAYTHACVRARAHTHARVRARTHTRTHLIIALTLENIYLLRYKASSSWRQTRARAHTHTHTYTTVALTFEIYKPAGI